MRAPALFAGGKSQADVVRLLQVSCQTVSHWFEAWQRQGRLGLAGTGRAGRRPKIGLAELKRMERALLRGPTAHRYPTELWTLERIERIIEQVWHVRRHPCHVWRLLGQLGWSCQRLERRARERDEAGIRRWVQQEWPRIKKPAAEGLGELPGRERVLGPPVAAPDVGAQRWTTIVVTPGTWQHLSAIATLVTTPSGRPVQLCLRLVPCPVRSPKVRAYLRALRRHLNGRRLMIVRNRLMAHRSQATQRYLLRQRRWLSAEPFPPYAPGLNPVEYFWAYVSGTDLANFCANDLKQVRQRVAKAVGRVRRRADSGRAFLKFDRSGDRRQEKIWLWQRV